MFENLVDVLHQIDPAKLNAVLTALAEGVRGQGERIGEATTDANQVLLAAQPAQPKPSRRDWQALKGFSDTYGAAARRHPVHPRRGQHDQHHHHQSCQRSWMPCCSTPSGSSDSGISLLGAKQGQSGQGHQRARADDRPAA